MTTKRSLVTGGAGFIGSALVRHLIHDTGREVCVLDKSPPLRQHLPMLPERELPKPPNHGIFDFNFIVSPSTTNEPNP